MFATSQQFWTTAETWYSGQVSARGQAKAGGYPVTRAARKEAQWRARGAHYLRNTGLPSQWIRVDPALQQLVTDAMEAIAPALADAYDRHLGGLALRVFRAWPVFTGLSKGLLALEYSVLGGGTIFKGTLASRAPYTVFIKGQPHRVLIDQPSRAVVDAIVADAFQSVTAGRMAA